jgi:hypothetical protein
MPKPMTRSEGEVVGAVAEWAKWWVGQRRKKLDEVRHETMSVNPFLIPAVQMIHGLESPGDLSKFLVAVHFGIGHATGFGKLVDEKLLPNVFGTKKLDASTRKQLGLTAPEFDEIDHLVPGSGPPTLLSVKASQWTIQLTMAVKLNHVFSELVAHRRRRVYQFRKIVVGVYSDRRESLSDKYDILRGINRGKQHGVVDLREDVQVLAGTEFWAWLNGGERQTARWVSRGIVQGCSEAFKESGDLKQQVRDFERQVADNISTGGRLDWDALVDRVSGSPDDAK